MNTFTFSNVKGGVGKTMCLYQVAGCLSFLGYSVLCIDADPQHNLSKALLGKTANKGLIDLLEDECGINEVITKPYPNNEQLKNIDLIPCNYDLFFFDGERDSIKSLKLKNSLESISSKYDFVLIDTNPAINLITTSVLVYVKNIIGVFDSSLDSIEGFQFLENSIVNKIKEKINPDLSLFGIILNNNDRRSNFSATMLKTTVRLYGEKLFDTTILPSIKNKESRAARLPLISYETKHPSAQQFVNLTNEIIERVGGHNG